MSSFSGQYRTKVERQKSFEFQTDNTPIILHVDMNSYFASVLQQENPHLRGKPIGVLKGAGRSAIIAASVEAKKLGVHAGASVAESRQFCPNMILVPASFERYLDVTRRLQKIFASVSPDFYIYSLDEAFIDLTNCFQYCYTDQLDVAHQLQEKIKNELGDWIKCSIGLSHNRLLCKMASNIAPKGGILEINHENKDYYLSTVGFEDVCGIGFRLGAKLAALGVTHPYQIRFYSPEDLMPTFGPFWSHELLRIAYGEDSHNLTLINQPLPHMKSVGRSITGYNLTKDETTIKGVIRNLIEEVTHKARKMNLAGRYVDMYLSGNHHHWYTRKTLFSHIQSAQEMFDVLYNGGYKSWKRDFPIIKFAVRLGMLKPVETIQPMLWIDEPRKKNLNEALDQINDKFGIFSIKPASLMSMSKLIHPEVTGFLGDRTYYGL